MGIDEEMLSEASVKDAWSTSDPHVRNGTNACLNSLLPYCQNDISTLILGFFLRPPAPCNKTALLSRVCCPHSYLHHVFLRSWRFCRASRPADQTMLSHKYVPLLRGHLCLAVCLSSTAPSVTLVALK